jgi:hypothetical protein
MLSCATLPANVSAEGITVTRQETDYDAISAQQMTAKHPTPEGGMTHTSLPFFQGRLERKQKAPENFRLTTLYNTVIKVEAY